MNLKSKGWYLGPIWLFGVLTLATYGVIAEANRYTEALNLKKGETAVLVGIAADDSSHQRSYILLPRVFSEPQFVTVVMTDQSAEHQVISSSALDLVAYLCILVFAGLVTLLLWRQRKSNDT